MTEIPEASELHRAKDYSTHEIVRLAVSSAEPTYFVVENTDAESFMKRVRVHLSRCRGAYKKKNDGQPMKEFRLKSKCLPYNESNVLILFWTWSSSANQLEEIIADLGIKL